MHMVPCTPLFHLSYLTRWVGVVGWVVWCGVVRRGGVGVVVAASVCPCGQTHHTSIPTVVVSLMRHENMNENIYVHVYVHGSFAILTYACACKRVYLNIYGCVCICVCTCVFVSEYIP